MFFLATPHRGSNHATTLNNVVNVFGIKSSRHYISDLMTASVSLQSINDDFEKHAHDLPIFSFCEGLKTSLGVSSILVVDKESAVLGIPPLKYSSFTKKINACSLFVGFKDPSIPRRGFSMLTQTIAIYASSRVPMIRIT